MDWIWASHPAWLLYRLPGASHFRVAMPVSSGAGIMSSTLFVAFYARPVMVDLLLSCACEANIGLEVSHSGCVVAYADDIRALRRFAIAVTDRRAAFRALRVRRSPKTAPRQTALVQLSFFP